MNATKLASVATVVGSLVLVGSWIFQQTLLDRANGKLERLYNAESKFGTYRSNNDVFNAILAATSPGKAQTLEVRRSQVHEYELALGEMERLLSPKERKGIPPTLISDVYSSADIFAKLLPTIQPRIDKIEAAFFKKEQDIRTEKDRLYWIFFALYLIGSALALSGTIVKTFGRSQAEAATLSTA